MCCNLLYKTHTQSHESQVHGFDSILFNYLYTFSSKSYATSFGSVVGLSYGTFFVWTLAAINIMVQVGTGMYRSVR